jgi:hypothetical protein
MEQQPHFQRSDAIEKRATNGLEPVELEQLIRFYFRKGGTSRMEALMAELDLGQFEAASQAAFALIPLVVHLREGRLENARALAASVAKQPAIGDSLQAYLQLLATRVSQPARESVPGSYTLARNTESPFTTLILLADGRIAGHDHPNEAYWGVEWDHLVLYNERRKPTSLLAYHEKRQVFIGPYLHDLSIHVLEPCNA